jgi:hypothetical protein
VQRAFLLTIGPSLGGNRKCECVRSQVLVETVIKIFRLLMRSKKILDNKNLARISADLVTKVP